MMDEERLTEIEERVSGYKPASMTMRSPKDVAFIDRIQADVIPLCAALREAWKRSGTLTKALEAQSTVVYDDGTHCFCNADHYGDYPLQDGEHSEWCRVASAALKEGDEAQV